MGHAERTPIKSGVAPIENVGRLLHGTFHIREHEPERFHARADGLLVNRDEQFRQEQEREQQQDGSPGRAPFITRQRGDEHADRERAEEQVREREHLPPEFAGCDPAQKQRQGEDRKKRNQAEEPVDRGGDHLAEHDVVAFQVGEEQQAEGALAFLFAQRIGGLEDPPEDGVDPDQSDQSAEQHFPGDGGGPGHLQKQD